MPEHPTLDQPKTLRLDGMAEGFGDRQTQDGTADPTHAGWLRLLIDRENASREGVTVLLQTNAPSVR